MAITIGMALAAAARTPGSNAIEVVTAAAPSAANSGSTRPEAMPLPTAKVRVRPTARNASATARPSGISWTPMPVASPTAPAWSIPANATPMAAPSRMLRRVIAVTKRQARHTASAGRSADSWNRAGPNARPRLSMKAAPHAMATLTSSLEGQT